MLLSTSIAIGYDVPWQRVGQLLTQASVGSPGIAPEPAPRVLPWELDEFYVRYQLHVHLAPGADRVASRAALNARILEVFAAAGVQIMTPHYESQPERPVIARPEAIPA
jgi:small-conductance mechanosensitive channel